MIYHVWKIKYLVSTCTSYIHISDNMIFMGVCSIECACRFLEILATQTRNQKAQNLQRCEFIYAEVVWPLHVIINNTYIYNDFFSFKRLLHNVPVLTYLSRCCIVMICPYILLLRVSYCFTIHTTCLIIYFTDGNNWTSSKLLRTSLVLL